MLRNYSELETDYDELEASRDQSREAGIQLQVLTEEHTAMTAQFNATCTDLAETKSQSEGDRRVREEEWKKCSR